MDTGLKPRVSMTCPICGKPITCISMVVENDTATWELGTPAAEHLSEAHK